jgi:REP element-mobilizing transposase RayT
MFSVAENRGWYKRDLPHFDSSDVTQSVTFRLADSLPQSYLLELREELKGVKGNIDHARRAKIESYLDQGVGSCILREPECAQIVQDSLNFLDGKNYDLRAWVVMPNHVHFLARFSEGQLLSKALHSLKSFTAHEIKKLRPEMSTIWQHESFDRYIRNEDHYWNEVRYLHSNPVTARLCLTAEEFRWSSAFVECQ